MIKRLRVKFIILSMTALFILLAFVITAMNVMNYRQLISEADNTLRIIAENGGIFPEFKGEMRGDRPHFMNPEAPYEARYFSVLFDLEGNALFADTNRITAVDSVRAIEMAEEALDSDKTAGFIGNYRYLRRSDDLFTRVSFLDCGSKLDSYRSFLMISVTMALLGYAGFFAALLLFSKRMVAPVAESYDKQKRFITDAGHEIKTPLTVIKADADVIGMEYGENEWVKDIQNQTDRLVSLTDDLVHLSRMEESGHKMEAIDFPLSDLVGEIAASFSTLARTQGKSFTFEIQPRIEMRGSEKDIIELTEILLENAVKYTPDGGKILMTLHKAGRGIRLSVKNTVAQPISDDLLKRMFERFYRLDASRNSETGGHGIGLSIAKAIVSAHGGKIQAETEHDGMLKITVSFPG